MAPGSLPPCPASTAMTTTPFDARSTAVDAGVGRTTGAGLSCFTEGVGDTVLTCEEIVSSLIDTSPGLILPVEGFGENSLIGITRPAVGLPDVPTAEFALLLAGCADAEALRVGVETTVRSLFADCDGEDEAEAVVKSRCKKSRTRRCP